MSKTIAVHVHCKSLYISLPFSTKQQREMNDQVLRILENLGLNGKYFEFSYENDRWHYIVSLSRLLDRFALSSSGFHVSNDFL